MLTVKETLIVSTVTRVNMIIKNEPLVGTRGSFLCLSFALRQIILLPVHYAVTNLH